MNIKSVTSQTVHFVATDEDGFREYTRYSGDSWTVRMGESDEPVYRCEELEAAFQAFISANVRGEVSLLASGAEGAQAASVTEVPKGQGLAPPLR